MFIDRAKVYVRGGDGGSGLLSFRREKFIPNGGPDGGNGGRGGDVIFRASISVKTLFDVRYHPHITATSGESGGTANKYGKDGKDLTIIVPCGTMVYNEDGQLLHDLIHDGQEIIIAHGGRGGRGNAAFLSNSNRAPYIREKGEPGDYKALILELKVLADVGLIGFPNAGKSTLLSVLSNASPKIASYPFTTLEPNLGVCVEEKSYSFVIADLPGLIEGASDGAGLGHQFLKHAERNRMLMYLIDMAGVDGREPWTDFHILQRELGKFNPEMLEKAVLVVGNKIDLAEAEDNARLFEEKTGIKPLMISAAAHMNLDVLKNTIAKKLSEIPFVEEEIIEQITVKEDKRVFTIERENDCFYVDGVFLRKLMAMTDMALPASVKRANDIMRKIGIYDALEKAGAKNGDTVFVAETFEFGYEEDYHSY